MDECGYFAIITPRKMTAKEAIHIYKSRDASEKAYILKALGVLVEVKELSEKR